jgi:hypothetical protein
MVHDEQAYHRKRSIYVRPAHSTRHRRFRGRDWQALQTTERRSRV